MNSIYMIIVFSAAATAISTLTADHTLHDSIPMTAIFEHEVESFLHYTGDYITSTTSFLISILEESAVNKHRDYPAASASFQYSTLEDRYERVMEKGVNSIIVEVTVEEGDGGEEKEKEKEVKG